MDRQAFPSIILSVSIVCFFAVALYEPEKVPRGDTKGGGARESTSTRELAGRDANHQSPSPAAAPGRSTTPTQGGAGRPTGLARKSDAPGVGPAAEATTGRRAEGALPAIRAVSKRTGTPAPAPPPSPRTAASSKGRLARAPFTIVGTGETVADVARRVYGTSADAGALWRANRDVLQRPDSPVGPGTVLRTPAAPLR